MSRARRRPTGRAAVLAVALVTLSAGACSSGRTYTLGDQVVATTTALPSTAPTTAGTAVTGRPSTAVRTSGAAPTSLVTTIGGGAGSPTGSPTSGAVTTAVRADRCSALAADPLRATEPTLPGGRAASSASIGVRLAFPSDWQVTEVTVNADQVLDPRLIPVLALKPDTPLKPFVVRTASNYPGLAVFRFPKPKQDLIYIAGVMREFTFFRKFQVQPQTLSGCLDGAGALGLVSTNYTLLQLEWMTIRGDSFYLVLGLGLDGGTAQAESDLTNQFSRVLDTFRWTR